MGFWLKEYRKYRLACGCKGGIHGTSAALAMARSAGSPARRGVVAQQDQRGRALDRLEDEFRNNNSSDSYRSKIFEFFEYCDYVRNGDDEASRYLISFENIFDYIFYVCFREKRNKKECGKRKRDAGTYLFLPDKDYDAVMKRADEHHQGGKPIPEPKEGISYSFFEQLRSSMKMLYKEQVARKTTSLHWDQIWTERLEQLGKMVQTRKRRQDAANFVEKIDIVSAPYTVVDKLGKIEQYLWDSGAWSNDQRKTFASLRNRYIYLRTLNALLRGESIFKEDLSDFFGVDIKGSRDPHMMEIHISQVTTGKTNGIYKLFGRNCRNKDVFLCAYGAIGFWLAYRFHCTGEMKNNPPDFRKREAWFNIKCLVGLANFAATKETSIQDTTYTRVIKQACKKLGFPENKQKHIGRYNGSVLREQDLTVEDLRNLGNWDPSVQEKAYSSKVPVKAIRAAGGYEETGGVYFNVRTIAVPSKALLEKFEEFTFADEWLPLCEDYNFDSRNRDSCLTAIAFLQFVQKLRKIVLQDAAFIMEFHPERSQSAIFKQLSVFQTDEFCLFRQEVRAACEQAALENPTDIQIQAVLPGLIQHLHANQQTTQVVQQSVTMLGRQMHERFDHVGHLISHTSNETLARTARAFNAAAETISPSSPSPSVGSGEEGATEYSNNHPTGGSNLLMAPFPGYEYQPKWADLTTARSIYNQWFGKGDYVDKPVPGGMHQLEKLHKNRWRLGWCKDFPSRQKAFSRAKKISFDLLRIQEKYKLGVDEVIECQELAIQLWKFSGLADKIGKKDWTDERLYGIAANRGVENEEENEENGVAVTIVTNEVPPSPTSPSQESDLGEGMQVAGV